MCYVIDKNQTGIPEFIYILPKEDEFKFVYADIFGHIHILKAFN